MPIYRGPTLLRRPYACIIWQSAGQSGAVGVGAVEGPDEHSFRHNTQVFGETGVVQNVIDIYIAIS